MNAAMIEQMKAKWRLEGDQLNNNALNGVVQSNDYSDDLWLIIKECWKYNNSYIAFDVYRYGDCKNCVVICNFDLILVNGNRDEHGNIFRNHSQL